MAPEMERSLHRRPAIQKQSQTNNINLQNPNPVSKVYLSVANRQVPRTALLARRMPINMELPGESESFRLNVLLRKNRNKRIRRNITKALSLAFVIMILSGGFLFSQSYLKLHKVFKGGTASAAALKPNVSPSSLKTEGSGRVNILLLGRGGGTHDAPDLTDSMMLVSIDPVNYKATLISIPRDLWVNVPGAGVMKINAAWETGVYKYLGKTMPGSTDSNAISAGFSLADQTISGVFGINIDYNLIVNFQAFKQAVDTLGGITVNVPDSLVDPTMAWENSNNPTLAQPGIQTFDGKKALLYVRSRETSSDFARAQRQRDVLVAIENKALSVQTLDDPLKISGLVNTLGNNVATDISINDAVQIYKIFSKISQANIQSLDLNKGNAPTVTTGNINGQSVVLPKAGLFNYSDIKSLVSITLTDPYLLKENAQVLLLNGTSTPGIATTYAEILKNLGYNVIGEANAPSSDYSKTEIINLNSRDKYTNNYLNKRFKTTSKLNLPKGISSNGADFVIILGSNEANPSQN